SLRVILERKPVIACIQRTTRLLFWPTACTSHAADKKVTNWKTGCAPNSNSCTTTPNCEAQTTRDASEQRRSTERIIHETHKINLGAGMPHVSHADGRGGESNAAPFERPDKYSRQR